MCQMAHLLHLHKAQRSQIPINLLGLSVVCVLDFARQCSLSFNNYKAYFEETFMKESGRKINPLKDWVRELKNLEDSYLDLKEKELESIDTD